MTLYIYMFGSGLFVFVFCTFFVCALFAFHRVHVAAVEQAAAVRAAAAAEAGVDLVMAAALAGGGGAGGGGAGGATDEVHARAVSHAFIVWLLQCVLQRPLTVAF